MNAAPAVKGLNIAASTEPILSWLMAAPAQAWMNDSATDLLHTKSCDISYLRLSLE